MRKINKTARILNAFTEPLPKGETWYEDRLNTCNGCEYNSKNSSADSLKDIAMDIVHAGVPFCRACGCFIDRKCSRKEETCGLIEKGMYPKWKALVIHTVDEDDFNVYNNSTNICTLDLTEDGSKYVIDYDIVNTEEVVTVQLVFEGEGIITNIGVGCGCTTPSFNKISETLTNVDIGLNMSRVSGMFTKTATVDFTLRGVNKSVTIELKGRKV